MNRITLFVTRKKNSPASSSMTTERSSLPKQNETSDSITCTIEMVKDRLKELSFTFLYYNLGGEMMYIINQRLTAQNTSPEKSHKGKFCKNETPLI